MASRFDYSRLEAKAADLLDRFGARDCRIVRAGAGPADPAKPWKASAPAADVVVASGVTVVGDNIGYRRGKRDAPQALTESSAGKAYARGSLPQILPGDWLEVPDGAGGYERHGMARAEPIKPGETCVLWELTLRS